jgi:monoamine oxidase
MNEDADVLVLGAGLSGLYAARLLYRAGLKVTLLEARDRIGGRVLSQRLTNGTTIDWGGQWIGPGQTLVPLPLANGFLERGTLR